MPEHPSHGLRRSPGTDREITLAEMVNRALDRGVFLRGEVVLSVADIDLIRLNLDLLLTSVEREARRSETPREAG